MQVQQIRPDSSRSTHARNVKLALILGLVVFALYVYFIAINVKGH